MEKPSRTVKQLQAMVQVRMNALASAGAQKTPADQAPIVGTPEPHGRDVGGRNWNVVELNNGHGRFAEFRAIVEALRLQYDIEEPSHL